MTILAFIAIFAVLDPLSGEPQAGEAMWFGTCSMLAGVFLGSAAWWLCLSGLTAALRKKMSVSFMRVISAMSAVAIGTFGFAQWSSGCAWSCSRCRTNACKPLSPCHLPYFDAHLPADKITVPHAHHAHAFIL